MEPQCLPIAVAVPQVHKIELFTTTLSTLTGLLVKFPNYLLVNYPIVNFSRSQFATFELPIWIDVGTPVDQLERLKKAVRHSAQRAPARPPDPCFPPPFQIVNYVQQRPALWKNEVYMFVGDVSHDKK